MAAHGFCRAARILNQNRTARISRLFPAHESAGPGAERFLAAQGNHRPVSSQIADPNFPWPCSFQAAIPRALPAARFTARLVGIDAPPRPDPYDIQARAGHWRQAAPDHRFRVLRLEIAPQNHITICHYRTGGSAQFRRVCFHSAQQSRFPGMVSD